MVMRPTALTIKASTNSGHSMWAIRRRSILSIALRLAFLAQSEEGLQNLPGDRRRHRATAASGCVFDQGGDGDRWIVGRRIGDEPGVVALIPFQLRRRDAFLAERDDLRGAGLAGDGDVG